MTLHEIIMDLKIRIAVDFDEKILAFRIMDSEHRPIAVQSWRFEE